MKSNKRLIISCSPNSKTPHLLVNSRVLGRAGCVGVLVEDSLDAGGALNSGSAGGNYLLCQGPNTVIFSGNCGYYGVDYVQLRPTHHDDAAYRARQATQRPASRASTRSLSAYLAQFPGRGYPS